MAANTIECPRCKTKISLTEALSADIKAQYEKESQQHFAKRESEMAQQQEAIKQEQLEWKKSLQERYKTACKSIEQKVRHEISSQTQLETKDMQAQLAENKTRIEELQKTELIFRKKTRELEEKQQSVELEIQRKFDTEKLKIQEEAIRKTNEQSRLKTAEKDKQIADMLRQIEDLKRKAEQGSQQTQGEVFELEIESLLRELFPGDLIEPVPAGIRGGDIIHKVSTVSGQHAGTIIWEIKRTKTWSDGWITKLKEDQRTIAAEFAVIVTQALPKNRTHLELIEGVWVVDFLTFRGLAACLRSQLIQIFHAKAMSAGKDEKLDFLYSYLTGTQFKQRIETIVESFNVMQEDLEKEKRIIQKSWAAREQQILRVFKSTVGMYGDVQGIIGASLPKIQALEFEALEECTNREQ